MTAASHADEPLDRGPVDDLDGAAVDLGVALDQLGLGGREREREVCVTAEVGRLAGVGHHRQPQVAVGEVGLQAAQPRGPVAP